LLQQLLGLLTSEQPVPQAEVVRPRTSEPRGSDSSAMAGWNFGSAQFGSAQFGSAPFGLTVAVCAEDSWIGGGRMGRIGAGWGHMLSMVFGKRFGSGGGRAEGNRPAEGNRTSQTFPW
ncbi:MAG TPA: hypothetical protein VG433_00835, partial [Pirellulales bacterium]|nr:hypothetical protein [Pirellulales bacterium]